jgi:hypothetical protein
MRVIVCLRVCVRPPLAVCARVYVVALLDVRTYLRVYIHLDNVRTSLPSRSLSTYVPLWGSGACWRRRGPGRSRRACPPVCMCVCVCVFMAVLMCVCLCVDGCTLLFTCVCVFFFIYWAC